MKRTLTGAALALLLTSGALVGCSPSDSKSDSGSDSGSDVKQTTLSFVSYSVPKAAYDVAQADFAKTDAGKGVTFESSYGASGDQSRAVESGKKADFVNFSLEPDVTRLVKAGLVADDWNKGATKGIVSTSVVVIVVRKGNPKNIKGWDDIVKPGIGIVTPNPGSSGSAKWNILAAWAHATSNGGTEDDGKAFITKLFANAVTLAASGREATTAFSGGTGDVLLSYENEAIFARQSGEDFDYVIPATTLQIENPVAVTKAADARAKDFEDYLLSDAGQQAFVGKGFRPAADGVKVGEVKGANDPKDPFPAPKDKLVTIADLGGWSDVNKKFFATQEKDGADGIITTIQNASGKGN